jgi:GNAT superfamily N-acetyltransferase
MHLREAHPADIPQLMDVRFSVKENVLTNRALVTEADNEDYLTRRGKGWVAEVDGRIVGFTIVSVLDRNVWALFVHPDFERQGVGKTLHDAMLAWYFAQTSEPLWLGTAPGTRAESFYRRAGWRDAGLRPNGEIRFEMTAEEYQRRLSPGRAQG